MSPGVFGGTTSDGSTFKSLATVTHGSLSDDNDDSNDVKIEVQRPEAFS